MIKYNSSVNSPSEDNHFASAQEVIKELRAQRNFHISGTALFLWL